MVDAPVVDMRKEPATTDEVCSAVAALAMRVAELEKSSVSVGGPGDGSDLRSLVADTAEDLRALRGMLVRAAGDMDEKLNELNAVKASNAKLKYQIVHLKRSLDEAEAS